jgi:His/Glu/Gln/Arg/opine family amino acid ABC transporter permease subunit
MAGCWIGQTRMSAPDFSTVLALWPALLAGAGMTLLLTGCVMVVATPPALLLALGRDRGPSVLRGSIAVLSWLVRGLPPLLLLLLVFFIPSDFGVNLPPFTAAISGLGVYMAFTYSEVFRAGFASVPPGPVQAAHALGLSPVRILWRIVLPQMRVSVVPPYMSHTSSLLKNTALTTVVAVRELTSVGKSLFAVTYRPLETLFVIGLIYAGFSAALFLLQSRLERRA